MEDKDLKLLKLCIEQLRINADNMEKGMPKSVQRLCAVPNRELIAQAKKHLEGIYGH